MVRIKRRGLGTQHQIIREVLRTCAYFVPAFRRITERQLKFLPPALSYSPITAPLSHSEVRHKDSKPLDQGSYGSITLPRRDLYDARYQIITDDPTAAEECCEDKQHRAKLSCADAGKNEDELGFFDNPSDLVPGIYEGGLKTWECALSLVDHLDGLLYDQKRSSSEGKPLFIHGKRILEV